MYAAVTFFQKHQHDFCFDTKQTIAVGLLKAKRGSDKEAKH